MSKCLWNKSFLEEFAQTLHHTPSIQFWELDADGKVMDFTAEHYKKMLNKFFPALGVFNLQLGENEKGAPTSTLVMVQGNRCEEIDSKTLKQITFGILNKMGVLGTDIRTAFYARSSNPVFNDEALALIPDLEDKTPFADNHLSAYRFFQNGWVEITSNGVSPLKSYDEIPDNFIVWNSSVIPREYKETFTKGTLEEQEQNLRINRIHPDTGEYVSSKNELVPLLQELKDKINDFEGDNPPTHFKDFIENLSRDDFGDVDAKSLERIELAIGYLCHRYNNQSKRKYVCFVDKFYDGFSAETANGGNGKSLLVNTLGLVMNLTNLNGKSFTKNGHRALLAPVTTATEIVHFDDASKKFDTERLFPLVTGNFHIEKLYKNPFSIPAKSAPKIAITSNHPLEGNGNSFRRREFIVEVGNYYRVQSEEYGRTPYEEHGHKNFPDCHEEAGNSWNEEDWNEYFRYVFKCIALYLSKGLPIGGESDYYLRAKLVKEIGSEEILDFIIAKLESYEVGKEYFNDALYKELHEEFPNELDEVSGNRMWNWVKAVGKFIKIYPNKSVGGKVQQQRLVQERWQEWIDAGLEHHQDRNGKVKKEGDRTYVFKVSSPTSPESMFATKPNFSKSSPEAEEVPATKPRKSIKKKAVKKQEAEVPDKDLKGLEQFLS